MTTTERPDAAKALAEDQVKEGQAPQELALLNRFFKEVVPVLRTYASDSEDRHVLPTDPRLTRSGLADFFGLTDLHTALTDLQSKTTTVPEPAFEGDWERRISFNGGNQVGSILQSKGGVGKTREVVRLTYSSFSKTQTFLLRHTVGDETQAIALAFLPDGSHQIRTVSPLGERSVYAHFEDSSGKVTKRHVAKRSAPNM